MPRNGRSDRIGHRVDQRRDNVVEARAELEILAAKRNDPMVDRQSGQPGDAVRLQARAGQQPLGGPRALARGDRDNASGLRDRDDLSPGNDLAACLADGVSHRLADAPIVDDAGGGRKDRAKAGNGRLAFHQFRRIDPLRGDAVASGALHKGVEAGQFEVAGRDDVLSAEFEFDAVLAREIDGRRRAATAQICLEAAGLVVDPGVDDTAVVAGLVPTEAVLLFEEDEACARPHLEQLHGARQADDAAANDTEVMDHGCLRKGRRWSAHPIPGPRAQGHPTLRRFLRCDRTEAGSWFA
jgi:hypothetical protein